MSSIRPGLEAPNELDLWGWLTWEELKRGVIHLDTHVDFGTVTEFLQKLDFAARLKPKEIKIRMTSVGGDAYSAFAIYDALMASSIMVIGEVEGLAASAAAMIILQGASVRRARAHARFLLHELSRWVFMSKERTSDMEDEVREMKAIEDMILDILVARCNKEREEISNLIKRKEVWMSAAEAKEWGLIDEVI